MNRFLTVWVILVMFTGYPALLSAQEGGWGRLAGEELFYDLSYGWIKGGEGHIRIHACSVDSAGFLRVVAGARSTGIVALFRPVRDRYSVVFGEQDALPRMARREVWQGRKHSTETLYFLDGNRRVRSSRSGDHLYPEPLFDVLSAFYQARRFLAGITPDENTLLVLPLFYDGRFFDLRLRYAGSFPVRGPEGKTQCALFVPVTDGNKTFTSEEQLQIWITTDGRALPLKIHAKLPFGSLHCELKKVKRIL